jgi:hypothetical protein
MEKGRGYCEKLFRVKSMQTFTVVLKGPAKSSNVFSIGTDASNQKTERYFRWLWDILLS